MKYIKMELGTGYCGEDETRYYELTDQSQTEITDVDYENYEDIILGYNESYGHDYEDYCDERDLDPEDGDYWDDYRAEVCENGCIEIVDLTPEEIEDIEDLIQGEW